MKAIYQYVVEKCAENLIEEKGFILDYGCGRGEIVESGLSLGLNINGVEEFYGGSDIKQIVESKGLLGDKVIELGSDGIIPFDDNFFDLVVSNQVFEHVQDLDFVINEITRVLKPNGKLICLFPPSETIREDHCGIAFTHWFPKDSKAQYYWLLLFRSLGFGRVKEDKSPTQWAKDLRIWLSKYTHYRSMSEIEEIFLKKFSGLQHIEGDYIEYRVEKMEKGFLSSLLKLPLMGYFSQFIYRKLGGVVLIATKK